MNKPNTLRNNFLQKGKESEGKNMYIYVYIYIYIFPSSWAGKESTCNEGDPDSNPRLGRSPGEGNATHSSSLAWRIPWTKEPGMLWQYD